MKLVKVDKDTFINIEKVCGLQEISPNYTYIFIEGDSKIAVSGSLYKVKKIIEDAMKGTKE